MIPTLRSVSVSLALCSVPEPSVGLLAGLVDSERAAAVLAPWCRLAVQRLDDGVNVFGSCDVDEAVVVVAWFGGLGLVRCAEVADVCDFDVEWVDQRVDCLFDVGCRVDGGEVAEVKSLDWSLAFLVAVAVLERRAGLAISAPSCSLERWFTAICALISLSVVKYA